METAAHAAKSLFAKAVITRALIRIRKHAVGFVDLFELLFGVFFLAHIRMILARKFTERGFDLIIARVPLPTPRIS